MSGSARQSVPYADPSQAGKSLAPPLSLPKAALASPLRRGLSIPKPR